MMIDPHTTEGIMDKHYVVAIGISGGRGFRKVLSVHASREAARADMATRSCRTCAVICRDGATGQRFSYNEMRELV